MITINYRDPRPIYEQVRDSLRQRIVAGALTPGERVPTVRELAAALAINPNTIARAYRELEAEGYLVSKVGRGTFVSDTIEVDPARKTELLQKLDAIIQELLHLGVSAGAMERRVRELQDRGGKA